MSVFVLVHGSWHGAWCWEKVAPLLQQAGHQAIAIDLPGHGANPALPGEDPAAGAVPYLREVLDAQAEPVVLVGHSSGGMIISEAARQRPERVRLLVYLAAFLLPPGVTPPQIMREDTETLLPAALVIDEARGTVAVNPRAARAVLYADCSEADAARAISRLCPERLNRPAGDEAPSIHAQAGSAPRVYIETLQDKALGPAIQKKMYTALPCTAVYSLATSHSPFISAPDGLAAALLDSAARFS